MDWKVHFTVHLEAAEKGWNIKIFFAWSQVDKEFETLNNSFFANLERDLHVGKWAFQSLNVAIEW